MNFLDFIIVISILFFAVRGIKNGLIGEVLGIIGMIASVYLTFQYMDEVADLIRPLFAAEAAYAVFVAAIIIFIVTLLLAQLLDYYSTKFLKLARLQSLNRTLGFFFGFLKGAIIVSALLLILAGFQFPSQQTREESLTYSYVVYIAPWTYNIVAETNFADTVEDAVDDTFQDFPVLFNN